MLLTHLKLAIFNSGRSQRALAMSLGMPESRLSNIVRGMLPASETERVALMRELGAGSELFEPRTMPSVEIRS